MAVKPVPHPVGTGKTCFHYMPPSVPGSVGMCEHYGQTEGKGRLACAVVCSDYQECWITFLRRQKEREKQQRAR